jgi:hypothetical protein
VNHITLTGSCLCGAVKYEVAGEAQRFYHCHCARCRKATGTGHASNLFLQPGALSWLSGQEHIRTFKVPEAVRFTNQFCAIWWPAAAPAAGHRQRADTGRIIGRRGPDKASGAYLHRLARKLVLLRRRNGDLPGTAAAIETDAPAPSRPSRRAQRPRTCLGPRHADGRPQDFCVLQSAQG